MNLLFLTPQLPYPPHQGTTLRNWNILRLLSANHSISVLSFGTSADLEAAAPLREIVEQVGIVPPPERTLAARALTTLLSSQPDMALRLASAEMHARVREIAASTPLDWVQVEGIEMASYVSDLTASPLPAPRVLFDDHNAEYMLQKTAYEADLKLPRRWHAAFYSYLQWHKLAGYEAQVCARVDAVVAVSEADAAALRALDPRLTPAVIPNGVDTELLTPTPDAESPEPTLVFTGKMDYRPNIDAMVWFCAEILPLVRREVPAVRLQIVGQKPAPRVQAIAQPRVVEVTGTVLETRSYVTRASLYVAPLRMGSGTRLKLLEAMALGKAIVTTARGAEGLSALPGRDLLVADSPAEMAGAIVALLRDPPRRRALGLHGRALAVAHYDWRMLIPRFEEIYRKVR